MESLEKDKAIFVNAN